MVPSAALCLILAGCATPGPLHVYSVPVIGNERSVIDSSNGPPAEVPSFLEAGDRVSGFAYDPFTDHFFLRLEPGNHIRVVDRPARVIKREFDIDGAGPGGDLAVRPRDGHLFLLQPLTSEVLETSRLGKVVRKLSVAGITGATGIAIDSARDRLLILASDGRRVTAHDRQGGLVAELSLAQAAGPSLAFDADQRELYAPLRAAAGAIGVFDETGKLLRTVRGPADGLVDVGIRSLVRVF